MGHLVAPPRGVAWVTQTLLHCCIDLPMIERSETKTTRIPPRLALGVLSQRSETT